MPYQVAYHISIQYHIFYTVLKIYSAYVLLFGNIFSLLERIYIFFLYIYITFKTFISRLILPTPSPTKITFSRRNTA